MPLDKLDTLDSVLSELGVSEAGDRLEQRAVEITGEASRTKPGAPRMKMVQRGATLEAVRSRLGLPTTMQREQEQRRREGVAAGADMGLVGGIEQGIDEAMLSPAAFAAKVIAPDDFTLIDEAVQNIRETHEAQSAGATGTGAIAGQLIGQHAPLVPVMGAAAVGGIPAAAVEGLTYAPMMMGTAEEAVNRGATTGQALTESVIHPLAMAGGMRLPQLRNVGRAGAQRAALEGLVAPAAPTAGRAALRAIAEAPQHAGAGLVMGAGTAALREPALAALSATVDPTEQPDYDPAAGMGERLKGDVAMALINPIMHTATAPIRSGATFRQQEAARLAPIRMREAQARLVELESARMQAASRLAEMERVEAERRAAEESALRAEAEEAAIAGGRPDEARIEAARAATAERQKLIDEQRVRVEEARRAEEDARAQEQLDAEQAAAALLRPGYDMRGLDPGAARVDDLVRMGRGEQLPGPSPVSPEAQIRLKMSRGEPVVTPEEIQARKAAEEAALEQAQADIAAEAEARRAAEGQARSEATLEEMNRRIDAPIPKPAEPAKVEMPAKPKVAPQREPFKPSEKLQKLDEAIARDEGELAAIKGSPDLSLAQREQLLAESLGERPGNVRIVQEKGGWPTEFYVRGPDGVERPGEMTVDHGSAYKANLAAAARGRREQAGKIERRLPAWKAERKRMAADEEKAQRAAEDEHAADLAAEARAKYEQAKSEAETAKEQAAALHKRRWDAWKQAEAERLEAVRLRDKGRERIAEAKQAAIEAAVAAGEVETPAEAPTPAESTAKGPAGPAMKGPHAPPPAPPSPADAAPAPGAGGTGGLPVSKLRVSGAGGGVRAEGERARPGERSGEPAREAGVAEERRDAEGTGDEPTGPDPELVRQREAELGKAQADAERSEVVKAAEEQHRVALRRVDLAQSRLNDLLKAADEPSMTPTAKADLAEAHEGVAKARLAKAVEEAKAELAAATTAEAEAKAVLDYKTRMAEIAAQRQEAAHGVSVLRAEGARLDAEKGRLDATHTELTKTVLEELGKVRVAQATAAAKAEAAKLAERAVRVADDRVAVAQAKVNLLKSRSEAASEAELREANIALAEARRDFEQARAAKVEADNIVKGEKVKAQREKIDAITQEKIGHAERLQPEVEKGMRAAMGDAVRVEVTDGGDLVVMHGDERLLDIVVDMKPHEVLAADFDAWWESMGGLPGVRRWLSKQGAGEEAQSAERARNILAKVMPKKEDGSDLVSRLSEEKLIKFMRTAPVRASYDRATGRIRLHAKDIPDIMALTQSRHEGNHVVVHAIFLAAMRSPEMKAHIDTLARATGVDPNKSLLKFLEQVQIRYAEWHKTYNPEAEKIREGVQRARAGSRYHRAMNAIAGWLRKALPFMFRKRVGVDLAPLFKDMAAGRFLPEVKAAGAALRARAEGREEATFSTEMPDDGYPAPGRDDAIIFDEGKGGKISGFKDGDFLLPDRLVGEGNFTRLRKDKDGVWRGYNAHIKLDKATIAKHFRARGDAKVEPTAPAPDTQERIDLRAGEPVIGKSGKPVPGMTQQRLFEGEPEGYIPPLHKPEALPERSAAERQFAARPAIPKDVATRQHDLSRQAEADALWREVEDLIDSPKMSMSTAERAKLHAEAYRLSTSSPEGLRRIVEKLKAAGAEPTGNMPADSFEEVARLRRRGEGSTNLRAGEDARSARMMEERLRPGTAERAFEESQAKAVQGRQRDLVEELAREEVSKPIKAEEARQETLFSTEFPKGRDEESPRRPRTDKEVDPNLSLGNIKPEHRGIAAGVREQYEMATGTLKGRELDEAADKEIESKGIKQAVADALESARKFRGKEKHEGDAVAVRVLEARVNQLMDRYNRDGVFSGKEMHEIVAAMTELKGHYGATLATFRDRMQTPEQRAETTQRRFWRMNDREAKWFRTQSRRIDRAKASNDPAAADKAARIYDEAMDRFIQGKTRQLAKMKEWGVDLTDTASLTRALDSEETFSTVLNDIQAVEIYSRDDHSWMDWMVSNHKSNLLGDVLTTQSNQFLSNLLMAGELTAKHPVRALQAISSGAIMHAIRNAIASWQQGHNAWVRRVSSEELGSFDESYRPTDFLSTAGRMLSFDIMAAIDGGFQRYNAQVHAADIVYRHARAQGKDPAAAREATADILRNDLAGDIALEAMFRSLPSTFQELALTRPGAERSGLDQLVSAVGKGGSILDEWLGKTTGGIMGRSKVTGEAYPIPLSKIALPFVRTTLAIARAAQRRSFLGSVSMATAAKRVWEAKKLGADKAEVEALSDEFKSRAFEAIVVGGLAMHGLAAILGSSLTGTKVDDREAAMTGRAKGEKTVNLFGHQIPFSRLEPFATPLAMAANGMKALREGRYGDIASDELEAMLKLGSDLAWFRLIAATGNVVEQVKSGRKDLVSAGLGSLGEWAGRTAVTMMPVLGHGAVRAAIKPAEELTRRDEGGFVGGATRELGFNYVVNRDVWGRKVKRGPDTGLDTPVGDPFGRAIAGGLGRTPQYQPTDVDRWLAEKKVPVPEWEPDGDDGKPLKGRELEAFIDKAGPMLLTSMRELMDSGSDLTAEQLKKAISSRKEWIGRRVRRELAEGAASP